MKIKYFNIPVFIPELACPFRCIYCNQKKITGFGKGPEPASVNNIIDKHLATIPKEGSHIEIAFFGGNFTGLSETQQKIYLEIASRYFDQGLISGIRLSTRPDYIDANTISLLKQYPVSAVEIGAQSMDEEVLIRSGRGHAASDVEMAAELVKKAGFSLGLQMMTGLPADTPEKSVYTAEKIAALGADNTRIYPTLIIKGTELEKMYHSGDYMPQSLEEAVELCARLFGVFERSGVEVLRMGLHPSEGLLSGDDLVAGPFSPSFGEMVRGKLWERAFLHLLDIETAENISVEVPGAELNYAIGYRSSNRKMLLKNFRKVEFIVNNSLKGREFRYSVS